MSAIAPNDLVLLTGATGYIGGELRPVLTAAGYRVRCLARKAARISAGERTEVVVGDVMDPASLGRAMQGVHTAYYLIHSMAGGAAFAEADRIAARAFGEAARAAGAKRIVYLGGLGDPRASLSEHLRSRQEVGEILRESGVPVIELRASIVIGCGSFSFEMIRALVERLPVMITPRWVATPCQPIAVSDVLDYLRESAELELAGNAVFEIGGEDRASYGAIMKEYARQRGLRRFMVPVPVLTPRLSSLWLAVVTPYHAQVGRALADSLRNPTIVRDDAAKRVFGIKPRGMREAIHDALAREDEDWGAAGSWRMVRSSDDARQSADGFRYTRAFDSRQAGTWAAPAVAFTPIRRIGGGTGWYCGNWLWKLRGLLDRWMGGAGMRPGRRDPDALRSGDRVDFWRVEAFQPDRRLRLAAEMKVPGRAWLEFEVSEEAGGGSTIRQTAVFDPLGLFGLLYWYALYPVHQYVFGGMLRGIVSAAEKPPGEDGR
jgi:uncharacterized protein YbjT (DUF2867 family)